MAQPNKTYADLRGDYGDLLLDEYIYQNVNFVNHADNLIIDSITKAIEILEKQRKFIDEGEKALRNLSIKGQVLMSLENARQLMSIYKGVSISKGPHICPPSQKDMTHFLDKWRKKRSKL